MLSQIKYVVPPYFLEPAKKDQLSSHARDNAENLPDLCKYVKKKLTVVLEVWFYMNGPRTYMPRFLANSFLGLN